jgi:hypothetical protein
MFSSLTESCAFCLRKGRLCNKVWGPKTQRKRGDLFAGSRAVDDELLLSLTCHPITPLSLIRDSQRSDLELFYVRFLHARHPPTNNFADGIILQNLWNVYGSNFGDECLLYAALSYACVDLSTSHHKIPVLLPRKDESRYHYYLFKAKFHFSLRRAIAQNKISECHLFSLFFVIESMVIHWDIFQRHLRPALRLEISTFEDGFLRILAHCTSGDSTASRPYHLRFLWGLALSQLCRCNYLFPGRLQDRTLMQPNFTSELSIASHQFQKPSLSAEIDPRLILHAAVSGVNPGWWGMNWLAIEGMGTLHCLFTTMFRSHQDDCFDSNILTSLTSSLQLMRRYMAELGDISRSFVVRNNVRPKSQCSNHLVVVSSTRT